MLRCIPSLLSGATAALSSSLLSGLQVYYKLEDLTDSSGSAMTLTNVNTVTFIAGKVNNAAHFVAISSQALTHADASPFQMGTGDFSMAIWFKAASDAAAGRSNMSIYGIPITGGVGYGIWRWDNALQASIHDATNVTRVETVSAFDGNWHLAVATFNRAGNVSLYYDNGTPITGDITAVSGSVNNPSSRFKFASNSEFDSDAYFNGDMDEFGLWNRVLTAVEISALWNGGSGVTYPF